ncbi:MAG: hypothetical protein ACTS43_00110 [Candidatus Hodgkinia cicadicola]
MMELPIKRNKMFIIRKKDQPNLNENIKTDVTENVYNQPIVPFETETLNDYAKLQSVRMN